MIAITGGTGLLGARLSFDLLTQGHQLRMLCRPSSNRELFYQVLDYYAAEEDQSISRDSIEWMEGDIQDVFVLDDFLSGAEYCIHAAAMVSFHPSDREDMFRVNIGGTANVVNACNSASIPLLYVSSVAALGREKEGVKIDESEVWKDGPYNSNYAISKYHAELEVWRGIEEGLEALMVNPSIIIGAGAEHRSSGTLFGQVKSGLRFYTNGTANVVDVRDVSTKMLQLWNTGERAKRFIMHGETLPYRNLFDRLAISLNKPKPSIHASPALLGVAWRLFRVWDWITKSKSPVTRESAIGATSDFSYSSEQATEATGSGFLTLDEAIAYHASFYN